MFRKNSVLRPADHGSLRVVPTRDWRFAAGEIVVPLVFSEMADAAREYPLIFLPGKTLYYALTGFEQGVNAYVDAEGRWMAAYIPARLRAYPFALTAVPEQPARYALVLDAEAPQLQTEEGERLFAGDDLSEPVKQRLRLLELMQKAEATTHRLVAAIRDAGLLVQRSVRVRNPDAATPALGGFEVVDERKLNGLAAEEFEKLRATGALPLIYAHLLSLANLRQGALARKYPELGRTTESEDMDRMLAADRFVFH